MFTLGAYRRVRMAGVRAAGGVGQGDPDGCAQRTGTGQFQFAAMGADQLAGDRQAKPAAAVAAAAEGLEQMAERGLVQAAAGIGNLDHHTVAGRSEEHTSELQSLMRISYAAFCLKKTHTTDTCEATRT